MNEFREIPDSEYFAMDAADQTSLKKLLDSPREYATYMLGDVVPSPALEFGKAAHSLVLGSGPEVMRRIDWRTKDGKEQKARVESMDPEDYVLLRDPDYERVVAMEQVIGMDDTDFRKRWPGRAEVAMVAEDPRTGLPLKGKADWVPDGPDDDGTMLIVDYKTSSLGGRKLRDPKGFARTAMDYGYHVQAAFYMRLYRIIRDYSGPLAFRFIVQQKQPPYDWVVRDFKDGCPEILMADRYIDHALNMLAWWRNRYQERDRMLAEMLRWGFDKTPSDIEFSDWQLLDLETEMESWR